MTWKGDLKRMAHRSIVAAFVCAAACVTATIGLAEEDHLGGYKIKDIDKIQPAGTYALNNRFGTETCELKKAQHFLVPSDKDGGNDPRGGIPGEFVCYKAKCNGPLPPDTEVDEQFALHTIQAKSAKLVCVPVDQCGNGFAGAGEQCDGADDDACPGLCQPDCTCGSPPACTGALVGGSCWFLGNPGISCDSACDNIGKTCDPATVSYAGSAGSDANCQAVLNALGWAGGLDFPSESCTTAGVGCALVPDINPPYGTLRARCATPATTCGASASLITRACACQ